MYASEHGYSAVVDLLLKAGANTENKDRVSNKYTLHVEILKSSDCETFE
jgi:hypothetical protein